MSLLQVDLIKRCQLAQAKDLHAGTTYYSLAWQTNWLNTTFQQANAFCVTQVRLKLAGSIACTISTRAEHAGEVEVDLSSNEYNKSADLLLHMS